MHRPTFYDRCLLSGHIPPEAFKYLGENGFIINKDSIPIIYHVPRHINSKAIKFNPERIFKVHLVYNYDITELDKKELQNFDYFARRLKR